MLKGKKSQAWFEEKHKDKETKPKQRGNDVTQGNHLAASLLLFSLVSTTQSRGALVFRELSSMMWVLKSRRGTWDRAFSESGGAG